jgi:LPS export ABC transporter protein LptC/lipopolysaccharide transport protein LptA
MATWQRRARLVIALGAVVLVVVVAFAFQRRAAVQNQTVLQTDPKALVESINVDTTRINADKEEVRIQAARMLMYGDGSKKGSTVTVTTTRSGGRVFVVKSDRVEVGKNESSYVFEGNVRLEASDGLKVQTERASYTEAEGLVRAAGPVTFERGRMSGSGIGFTYDKNQDRLRVLKDARVLTTAPVTAEGSQPPMTLTSDTLELDRVAHIVRFDDPFKVTRGAEIIQAERGLARLTADEDRLQMLELRGRSEITPAAGEPGALQKMTGRDIDLTYGADGETLEHARVVGDAIIRIAGDAEQGSRQISAESIEVPLGAGGTRPTALTARGRVELTLPADKTSAARTITADSLDGKGDAANGLTGAVFAGKVVLREQASGVDRTARSEAVQVAVKPGFSAIDEANFQQPVQFVDGSMTARAARGRYGIAAGTLELSGNNPAIPRPNVTDSRISIDANTIDIVLKGPIVHAKGAVRSALQPARADGEKTPSMFKKDQPVNIGADDLQYDGGAEEATYAGNALLFQAETTIKGTTITIDNKSGDLRSEGNPVATTAVLMQTTKDGKKERTVANAKAKEFTYRESDRRASYVGEAYVNGPQGELRSPRIELFLKPSGDEVERVEAYDGVTLTEPRRKTTGDRLTYTSADEKYVVTGRPVKSEDECDGVTEGRSLTYLKGADRIIVDGSEQMRTRTQGTGKCP